MLDELFKGICIQAETEDLVPEFQPTEQELITLCKNLKVSVDLSDRNYYYKYEQKRFIRYLCQGNCFETEQIPQLQEKVLKQLNRKMDQYAAKVLEPENEKFTRNRLKYWRLRKFSNYLFLLNLKEKMQQNRTDPHESNSSSSSTSGTTVIFSGQQPVDIIGERSDGENNDTVQINSAESHVSDSETFLSNTEENFLYDTNSNDQSTEENLY